MKGRSLSKGRLKEIRSLTQKKYRDRLGEMLVEGLRSVEAALEAKAPVRDLLMTADAKLTPEAQARAAAAGIHRYEISDAEMKSVSDVRTSQGLLAVVAIDVRPPEDLHGAQRIVVFDGLHDPGNVGTLVRTAAWFGVDAVVTAPGTVDLYNPKAVRAAMGGLWDVAHVHVADLAEALRALQRDGFALYGADLEGTPIDLWRPSARSVLVLGGEAHGLSESVFPILDERVVVPGRPRRHGAESLNVAVAAGILMREWTRVT